MSVGVGRYIYQFHNYSLVIINFNNNIFDMSVVFYSLINI